MFIRVKNMQTETELNVNSRNIVSFEPANEGKNSKIYLSNGQNYIVDASNRTLRHGVKKAQKTFATAPDAAPPSA